MLSTSRLFSIVAFTAVLSVALLPLLTIFIIKPAHISLIDEYNREGALRTSLLMADILRPQDIIGESRNAAHERMDKYFKKNKGRLGLRKLQVISPNGTALFSTETREVGAAVEKKDITRRLSLDVPVVRTLEVEVPSPRGEIRTSSFVQVTLPIVHRGDIVGAFRLLHDVTASKRAVNMLLLQLNLMLAMATALIIFVIVKSTQTARKNMVERESTQKALEDSEQRYRTLVESTDDSIYLVDSKCNYIFMNIKHRVRLGISGEGYEGRPFSDFHSSVEAEWFSGAVAEVVERGQTTYHEHRSKRTDNYFMLTMSPIKSFDGTVTSINIVSKNITDRKRLEDDLRAIALKDDLTGLCNRRGFAMLAGQQLKLCERNRGSLSMIYMDIVGLKEINNKHGYEVGDQVLRDMADILRESFRGSDIYARIEGDEFVVLPVDCAQDCLEEIIMRLREGLRRKTGGNGKGIEFSIQVGKVEYQSEEACSANELLFRAYMDMKDNPIRVD